MNKKKVILTGSGGWLGKATIAELEKEFELTTLTRNINQNLLNKSSSLYWDGSTSIHNIIPADQFNISTIIHSAAYPYSLYRILGSSLKILDILKFETNLFESLFSNVPPKQLIYISSSSAYSLCKDIESSIQDAACHQINNYGLSKFIIEQAIIEFARSKQVPFSIIRPYNIFSLEESPTKGLGHLYSDLIHKILIEKQLSFKIGLPRTHIMIFTPEKAYTNLLQNQITHISNGHLVELANKSTLTLEEFVDIVNLHGLESLIISSPAEVSYSEESKPQYLDFTRPSISHNLVDINPKQLLNQYLQQHLTSRED